MDKAKVPTNGHQQFASVDFKETFMEEVDQEMLEEMDTVTIRAPSALEVKVLVTNIMCKAMPMIYHKKMIPIELLVIERVGLP